jgi:hypothetical protein
MHLETKRLIDRFLAKEYFSDQIADFRPETEMVTDLADRVLQGNAGKLGPDVLDTLDHSFLRHADLVLKLSHQSKREYLISASLVGVELAAHLLRRCNEEETQRALYTRLIYLTTVHDQLVGAMTMANYFTTRGLSGFDLGVLDRPRLVICVETQQELRDTQIKMLLRGWGVSSTAPQPDNRGGYFILDPPQRVA